MEAAQANIFIYLQPVVGIVLAAMLVGEAITLQLILGGVTVLVGAWLALSNKKKKVIEHPLIQQPKYKQKTPRSGGR